MDEADWKLPWEGGCRCGQLRFRISAPPFLTMACHCTGCQRMTGSAFSLSVGVPAEGFAVLAGTPVVGGLRGVGGHQFCDHCMSWVYTRPEGMAWLVNVRATMLDDPAWAAPFVETWTSERLPWAITPARHSFEALPADKDFPAMIEEFRREGPRPA